MMGSPCWLPCRQFAHLSKMVGLIENSLKNQNPAKSFELLYELNIYNTLL